MGNRYDVIVVGAGFAGATAARECATRGLRTLVLEGRDRVGGRTWTRSFADGEVVEVGGHFVHWMQPHVWSEITRYGLQREVVDSGEHGEWVLAPRGDRLAWSTVEEHGAREKALLQRFFEASPTVLARPYDPLYAREAIAELDRFSVLDRLEQLDLDPDDRALLTAMFGVVAPPAETGFVSYMRWWAPGGHTYEGMEDSMYGLVLKRGTVSLIEPMLADGGAELRLESTVTGITSDDDGVEVTCAGGEAFSASTVVVATPLGVWRHIDFSPPLSSERMEAAGGGLQRQKSAQCHVLLKGESRRFTLWPHADHPIGAMWTIHKRSEDEQVALLYPRPVTKDASDPAEVSAAIQDLLPHVEVLEVVSGTYYESGPFTRGGSPVYKPGVLTSMAPHETMVRPEGRVFFATSDIATLWVGFIDGAIETGLRAGQEVLALLGEVGRERARAGVD